MAYCTLSVCGSGCVVEVEGGRSESELLGPIF